MVQRRARVKVIRRMGQPLPGLTRKEPKERGAAPGRGKRPPKKKSDYGRRLEEKQKVRAHYGITETQLRRYFELASRSRGVTGQQMLWLLERRLDNVVFRLGFAPTIPAARQLVGHGHVLVNGTKVDRPAQLVEEGDEIAIATKARQNPGILKSIEQGPSVRVPGYLARNEADPMTGRVSGTFTREDVPFVVDETAIVEFYAR